MKRQSIGIWDCYLGDDGSLDTIIEVFMRVQSAVHETVRFDPEHAAEYRDEDGSLSEEGFEVLCHEAVEIVETTRTVKEE